MLLSVEEIHEGREGGDEISSKERSKMTRVRKFRAVCTSPFDGPDPVIAAMDPLGTVHPTQNNCFLVHRDVKNHAKSKIVFIATQSYSSEHIVGTNPFNDPAEISWGTEQYSRIYQFDAAGKAVTNSVNDSFVPGVQDPDCYWVVTVKKNVTAVPTWLLNYRNSVNSSAFIVDSVSVPPYCGWMKAIRLGHTQYRSGVAYRALEFSIAIKSGSQLNANKTVTIPPAAGAAWPGATTFVNDDWYRYILDEGYKALYVAGNPNFPSTYLNPLPVKNADGTTSRVKVLLDGTGKQLTGGPNPPNNGSPSLAVFVRYLLKYSMNFSILPLS